MIAQETSGRARLLVGPGAAWYKVNDGALQDISTRQPARRILVALSELALTRPEAGLLPLQVFAAGWPGELAHPDSAAGRVYTAVHTLRYVYALDGILRRARRGYFLDAVVRFAAAESQIPPRFADEERTSETACG